MRTPKIESIGDWDNAVTRAQAGEDIVLVANRTIPKDIGAVEIIDPQHLQAGSDKTISEIAQYLDTYLEWEKEFPGDAQPAALRVADQP